ncbi:hypothetical protein PZ938_05495 [Luteipulveratus sp. YIM 133132]|uniref:hypothetical protein n=1 Tax=Luteipulveratus flavus TaxID=3031728 RepID=UPI0023B0AA74|nr:hypothetical protein [Luteipulveratus sp. YIM 133132]MDE9365055.1 hypothetical protein [Luteipulveratus sp. YIM 133132]
MSYEVQVCSRCEETKAAEAFAWRNRAKGTRQSYCRTCASVYSKSRREALPNGGDHDDERVDAALSAVGRWRGEAPNRLEDLDGYQGGRIHLPGGWAAFSTDWAEDMARNEGIVLPLRVMFAAMGRVQPRSGLAYFHERELGTILHKAGEAREPNRVADAVNAAVAAGYVREGSTARRVWLRRGQVQRGDSDARPMGRLVAEQNGRAVNTADAPPMA